ncbi:MAG: M24 family metallopeptidase [Acidobacteria bacterium]|nr:M24 family metallopeptidase [Acidobacteriota bacterium]
MNLSEIQAQLREEGLDGWLFFDHHHRDPIAYRVLGLSPDAHVSRRWYYWLPAEGEPVRLVHAVEPWTLESLPGRKQRYSSWKQQRTALAQALGDAHRIAMQYSENCMIPYVSLVDAGTVELVRSLGKEVVSSASLVQYFEARWSEAQFAQHQEAGVAVDATRREAFELIGERLKAGQEITERQVADLILQRFSERGLVTRDGPIVAVNANSGDPHYTPGDPSSPIYEGDFVLIDLWAKLNQPGAVYYDVTWTGYCGAEPRGDIQLVFEAVRDARDAGLAAVDKAIREGRPIAGFEVDDVVRKHIDENGYGDFFIHRTGHSIGEDVHGNGANMDNLETHDDRPIIPGTCFSIEPGVYLDSFGVRSEINCYVSTSGAVATGEVQQEIVHIGA